jgi:signal transduction histidine kinase
VSSVKSSDWLRLFWISFWLLFTVAFAFWWFKLSSQHISMLQSLQPERADHWERQQRMILWEGSAWIVLLGLGGGALIALVLKEKSRVQRIREFFASFSHEIKTSLASLRLQAEALKDNSSLDSPILDRLIGDTVRLQVQLENSLFFASQDHLKLYVEPIRMSSIVDRMREQWPNLKIELTGDATVQGDDRALRTIFSNLLQNAMVHGKASAVAIDVKKISDHRLRVKVSDDGSGFKGETKKLGTVFHRPTSESGSGLGLYICGLLIEKMGGCLERNFAAESRGFHVSFELPGDRL